MYAVFVRKELAWMAKFRSRCSGAGNEPDCKMAEAAFNQERAIKAIALSPAFTAPAEFSLDNHSPASALSELDGVEFDGLGLGLGPELQFLLDTHLAESPMHNDNHLLNNMDRVGGATQLKLDMLGPADCNGWVPKRDLSLRMTI